MFTILQNKSITYHEDFKYTKLQVFNTPATNGKNTKAVFWKQKEINLFWCKIIMIPLLLCGIWLSHWQKQMATNKAGYPGAEGWSSKDGEMNTMGVCIKDSFIFFLKQYNCSLFLKVSFSSLQSWLPRSALSATLNWVIFHFFAFPHLQTEVNQKSEPAQLEVAQLVHPVQGWWNGKEGTELSHPLLVQNVMKNWSGITSWDTWSRVSGLLPLLWRLQPLVKNDSEEQKKRPSATQSWTLWAVSSSAQLWI